jgi:hypothetical protein
VLNKILFRYFALYHCHSGFATFADATACYCVTVCEDSGEELVDFFGAHVTDIEALGAVAD